MKYKQKQTGNTKLNRPGYSLDEIIAYECHVKGLTADASSLVVSKGSFKGLAERIPDLKKLGVNQLILLPVYDFNETLNNVYGIPDGFELNDATQLKNYWGFTEGDYFKIKEAYSESNPEQEFSELVAYAHQESVEIILMLHFLKNVNTEMMLKSLITWSDKYGIDGFFLNVNAYYLKMISDCSELEDLKLYTYDIDYDLEYTKPERMAVYDYQYRTLLRKMLLGSEKSFAEYINYINSNSKFKRICSITSHDGFTLWDLYSYSRKHNEANGEYNRDGEDYNFSDNCGFEGDTDSKEINELRIQKIKNAFTMLLLSDGLPMLLAGDEVGNSQKGNNNAYCQDNEISWIQYNGKFANELKAFVKALLELRNSFGFNNSDLHYSSNCVNKDSVPCFSVHTGESWECRLDHCTKCAGIMYAGNNSYLYIAANFDKYEQKLAIPHLPKGRKWSMIARTDVNLENDYAHDLESYEVSLKSNTVCVFIGK